MRVFFALVAALLAVALLLTGGLDALKTAAITTALPFSIVLLLTCWSTIIAFTRERRAYDKAERDVLLEHVGQYYGLEVEAPSERGGFLGSLPGPLRAVRRRVLGGRGSSAAPLVTTPSAVSTDPAIDSRLDDLDAGGRGRLHEERPTDRAGRADQEGRDAP